MKTKTLLTVVFFAFCLLFTPKSFVAALAESTSVTAKFIDVSWHTKAGQPVFTSVIDGYVMSSTKGVALTKNQTGSAFTIDPFPSVTSVSFLVNGNTLGRGSLALSMMDGEEEQTFPTKALDTSLEASQVLTFDTYGSGQVKFLISCTDGTIYLSSMTVTYGDPSLSSAHQYASSFLEDTENKSGQCHLIDWSSFEEDYLLLDEGAKSYLRESNESTLLQAFQVRYEYLESSQPFHDFLAINQQLSKISNHQEDRRLSQIMLLFILGLSSIGIYHLLQRKPHHLN